MWGRETRGVRRCVRAGGQPAGCEGAATRRASGASSQHERVPTRQRSHAHADAEACTPHAPPARGPSPQAEQKIGFARRRTARRTPARVPCRRAAAEPSVVRHHSGARSRRAGSCVVDVGGRIAGRVLGWPRPWRVPLARHTHTRVQRSISHPAGRTLHMQSRRARHRVHPPGRHGARVESAHDSPAMTSARNVAARTATRQALISHHPS